MNGRHRAPPNDLRRIRVLYVAAVAVLLGGVIGTAQAVAPHAVTSAPLPREPEPRPHPHYARPVIPVIGDPAAPHYEPVSAPSRATSVNTPPGQPTVAPRWAASPLSAPVLTPQAVPDPTTPSAPEPTHGETLAPPVLPGLPEVPIGAEPEAPTPTEDPEPIVETPAPTEPIASPVEEPQSNPMEVAP